MVSWLLSIEDCSISFNLDRESVRLFISGADFFLCFR